MSSAGNAVTYEQINDDVLGGGTAVVDVLADCAASLAESLDPVACVGFVRASVAHLTARADIGYLRRAA